MNTKLSIVRAQAATPIKAKGKRYYPKLPDAGVAATEDTLSRHEAAIFDFRRKHAPASTDTKATIKTKDGHDLTIVWHPEFGRPNATAYLVLQALFFKSTQEGHPFPEAVSFTENELLGMIGRAHAGGNDHEQLYNAINALRWVELRGSFADSKTQRTRTLKLRIFGTAAFVRDDKTKELKQATIYWDPALRQRMNDDYWHAFNYDRIKGAGAVEFAMYKQLFFRFSKFAAHLVWGLKKAGQDTPDNIKKALAGITYTKDKDDFFQEYLGQLKAPKTISEFIRQFGDRLDDLKARGIAANWKIEKNAAGDGHNLTFKPAQPFVQDWVAMNQTKRQPRLKYDEAKNKADITDPMGLFVFFHQTLSGVQDLDRDSFHANEFAFAKELIEKRSAKDAQDFIAWAIAQARKTKYAVRQLDGLRFLVNDWLKVRQHAERARSAAEQVHRSRDAAAQAEAFAAWRSAQMSQAVAAMPPDELAELTARIRAEVGAENPPNSHVPAKLIDRLVEQRRAQHIAADLALPTLEEWLARARR